MNAPTHRERAGEHVAWLDRTLRLRGVVMPTVVAREVVDALEDLLDEAVSDYANATGAA